MFALTHTTWRLPRRLVTIAIAVAVNFVPIGNALARSLRVPIKKRLEKRASDDPRQRLEWETRMLRDPKTGRIPRDIETLEQEFARSLPTVEELRTLRFGANGINAAPQSVNWSPRGPNNVGGRTRALAYDVSDTSNKTILAGGVSGGIWRTTDGGLTWSQTFSPSQLHSVTCIEQDTRNGRTSIWYAGTGEFYGNSASESGAHFAGNGIYKSTDRGLTWSLLSSTSSNTPQTFDEFDFVWNVVVDVSNTSQDEIYAATYGGIRRSTDGGATWSRVLGNGTPVFTDVAVTSTGILYATVSSDSTGDAGLFRSTNGTSWTEITPSGFPSEFGRIAIGIAPSNELIVYFLGFTQGSGTNGHSFWRYDGSNFTDRSANLPTDRQTTPTMKEIDTQGGYDIAVTVRPNDANVVFIAGTCIYRSTDAFASTANTRQVGGYVTTPGDFGLYPNHHPDVHALVFQPGSSYILLSGDDGGVHRTTDANAATVSWTPLNNGYITSQFYTVAIDESASGNSVIVGGLQDQGWWHNAGTVGTDNWKRVGSGDGTFTAIAAGRSNYYLEFQNGALYRSEVTDTGTIASFMSISPNASGQLFVNPFGLDPNDSAILYYAGGRSLWRNSDAPNATETTGWTRLTSSTATGTISAIGISRSIANRVYYGTVDGEVYRLDGANSGATPTRADIWSGKGLPTGYVSSIAVDPADGNRVLLVFSNYNITSLFYTSNGGSSWTSVSGNLEQNSNGSGNGPSCRWAVIVGAPTATHYLVGTSVGLYSATQLNGASTAWAQEGANTIGNVVVRHLAVRQSDGLAVVATHANGVYSGTVTGSGGADDGCGSTSAVTIPASSDAGGSLTRGEGVQPAVRTVARSTQVTRVQALKQIKSMVAAGSDNRPPEKNELLSESSGPLPALNRDVAAHHNGGESQRSLSGTRFRTEATGPNLTPYRPNGWSDKIVVSVSAGTSSDATTVRAADMLYIDWAVINAGGSATTARFYTSLKIDGTAIGTWYTDPPVAAGYYVYIMDVTVAPLTAGSHTITVVTDTTGTVPESNETDNSYSRTINIVASTPNLLPYQPSGWSDKIVVSTTTGTTADSSTIRPTDSVYVDWAVLNSGGATNSRYYIALKLDGATLQSWYMDPPHSAGAYSYTQDYAIGSLSAGNHTLTLVADSTGAISESNEDDNTYSRTVTVYLAVPNLTPYKPAGWGDKIVVSTTAGTTTDASSFTTADNIFVDWAVVNNGAGPVSNRYDTALTVDGVPVQSWYTDPPQPVGNYSYTQGLLDRQSERRVSHNRRCGRLDQYGDRGGRIRQRLHSDDHGHGLQQA